MLVISGEIRDPQAMTGKIYNLKLKFYLN